MTRKVTFGGAVSLDGYFAGPGEAIDWLRWSDDAAAVSAVSWKGADTMLMGRKTFDFAMREGHGPRVDPSKIRTFVFSRTLAEVPAGAELVKEDAARFVGRLRAEPGGGIIVMGGGERLGPDRGGAGRRDRAQRPSGAARRRHSGLPADGPAGGAGAGRDPGDGPRVRAAEVCAGLKNGAAGKRGGAAAAGSEGAE